VESAVDPIATDGVACSDRLVKVEHGVALRVFQWEPEAADAPPILFVAGWISLLRGWLPLLEVLVRRHAVTYVETREKTSAEIDRGKLQVENFTIDRLADDVVAVARSLRLDDGGTVLFGSSMGSNAILEALKHDRLLARAAFVVGPNAEFRFPGWGRLAARAVPAWVIERLKGFVIWYLKRFRVNARSDPEQMARYVRTVRAADALRLKLSAMAVLDYTLMPGLETVTTPVAVAYAASDSLHGEHEQQRIVDALPRGTAVMCPSNTYMHTAEVAHDLEAYLAKLGGAGSSP
jgi:pimeloyl-ACP methyl ester carboxylesterase